MSRSLWWFFVYHFWTNWNLELGNVDFRGERKTGVPREKPLGAKERTNNKLNPHMASTPGFEPGQQWWKASTLTTATPWLLKQFNPPQNEHTVESPLMATSTQWPPVYNILQSLLLADSSYIDSGLNLSTMHGCFLFCPRRLLRRSSTVYANLENAINIKMLVMER